MPLALVTEELAAEWTGRSGSTIRGWAHKGRIHRYGSGRGQVRYNLFELPSKGDDGEPAETPALLAS
jgi:hypothetical protein